MSWRNEFGSEYMIPSFIDQMISVGILEDESWHNDEAPSFVITSSKQNLEDNDVGMMGANENESYVKVWIDHIIQAKRERPEMPRWGIEEVSGLDIGDRKQLYVGHSDKDLERMIKAIIKYFEIESANVV